MCIRDRSTRGVTRKRQVPGKCTPTLGGLLKILKESMNLGARHPFDGTESNPYLRRSFCTRGLMMKLKNSSAIGRDTFRQVHTIACPNWTGVYLPAGASSMMRTCPLL